MSKVQEIDLRTARWVGAEIYYGKHAYVVYRANVDKAGNDSYLFLRRPGGESQVSVELFLRLLILGAAKVYRMPPQPYQFIR